MRIVILSIALLFCAFSARSQVLKSAGVWYFLDVDSLNNRPAQLPNGTELAYVVGTKKIYRWNRALSVWEEYSSGSTGLTMPFDSIYFTPTTVDPDTAELKYNADLETFVFGADGTTIEIGQKTAWYVKNQTGSTITKGTVVRASGTLGSSGRILISPMVIDGSVPSRFLLGIAASDITNGSDGYVIHFGKLRKFNTLAWADGTVLYVGTGGTLTATEPSPPNLRLPIAFVVHSHATNGVLAIRVQTGNELHELHDVDTTGLQNNGMLTWNSSSQKWQASAPDNDKSSTNEIQNIGSSRVGNTVSLTISSGTGTSFNVSDPDTLTFISPDLSISGGNSVSLLPILNGYTSGTGTVNRIPYWNTSTSFSDSPILYNSTTKRTTWDSPGVIELPMGTDAQRPSPATTSDFWYNTTGNGVEWYNGTRWAKGLESTFNRGTATRVPFFDANGQVTDDAQFFYTTTGVRNVTVPAGSATNSDNGLEIFGSDLGAGTAGLYFSGGILNVRSDNGTRLAIGNAVADFVAPNAAFRLNTRTIFNAPTSTALQVGSGYRDIYIDPTTGTTPTRVFMFGTANGNNIKFRMLSTTGFLGLNMGTTDPRYQLDVTSTDAFAFPRGTVAQRPTIASNTTPLRFNTDSIALEYGESVGTWRLLATRAYARSLVSGVTWLKPQLETGDVTINAASGADLKINNLDTAKFGSNVLRSWGNTLLLYNTGVGATGITSTNKNSFHTVINGSLSGSNGGTGQIIIGGNVIANSDGANFNLVTGYSASSNASYATVYGYNASVTADNAAAFGRNAASDEVGEMTLGSTIYNKINLNTNSGDVNANADLIVSDSTLLATTPAHTSITGLLTRDANGWVGRTSIGTGLSYSGGTLSATVPNTIYTASDSIRGDRYLEMANDGSATTGIGYFPSFPNLAYDGTDYGVLVSPYNGFMGIVYSDVLQEVFNDAYRVGVYDFTGTNSGKYAQIILDKTENQVKFAGNNGSTYSYNFPNSSPSTTSAAKTVLQWTGDGTNANPSFVEVKRDTTIYVTDADYNFGSAITNAQVLARYNRIIIYSKLTASATSDNQILLPSAASDFLQCTISIYSNDASGDADVTSIDFTTNGAVDGAGGTVSSYSMSGGQKVEIRPVNDGGFKWMFN